MRPAIAPLVALLVWAGPLSAQEAAPAGAEEPTITLDFHDAEISDIIKAIAVFTERNFIYDDRVRGRVTVLSPRRTCHPAS